MGGPYVGGLQLHTLRQCDRSTGSGQLGKTTASPPLVWASVCSSCRDLWQLGEERTRATAPVKKWETGYSPKGNLRLMLGVGTRAPLKRSTLG